MVPEHPNAAAQLYHHSDSKVNGPLRTIQELIHQQDGEQEYKVYWWDIAHAEPDSPLIYAVKTQE